LISLGQGSLDGKDRASSNDRCKTHTSECIKYYCPKHDVVACGDCIVADHSGCKMEFISVLAKKFEISSEFTDIVKSLEKLEVENNESKQRLANNRKENKAFLDKTLSEIKRFRKEINDHLDKVEKEIASEANKRFKEIEDLMSKLEKMTSVAEQEIDDLRNNLDSKIIQGEKLFVRTKECKPKLSKVDGNIAYIRAHNVLKGFTFEQEKQLAGMIRSGIKLGCLRMDTAPEEASTVVQKTQQPLQKRNPVLKGAAEKQVEAKQKFLPPGSIMYLQTSAINVPSICSTLVAYSSNNLSFILQLFNK
jgi:chromosome segregation ATPase